MKRLTFKTDIHAPAATVYSTMLGLDDKATYEAWAAEFDPTSTYKGNWEKGSKIHFVGTDKEGKKGGMACEVAENIPDKFVSLRPYGFIQDGKEVTEGEGVEKWVGGEENYSFEENSGITTLTVEIDLHEDYVAHFDKMYRKALDRLKSNIES